MTLALDAATGTERWIRRCCGGGEDIPTAITVSPDGSRVFVTGTNAFTIGTVAY